MRTSKDSSVGLFDKHSLYLFLHIDVVQFGSFLSVYPCKTNDLYLVWCFIGLIRCWCEKCESLEHKLDKSIFSIHYTFGGRRHVPCFVHYTDRVPKAGTDTVGTWLHGLSVNCYTDRVTEAGTDTFGTWLHGHSVFHYTDRVVEAGQDTVQAERHGPRLFNYTVGLQTV